MAAILNNAIKNSLYGSLRRCNIRNKSSKKKKKPTDSREHFPNIRLVKHCFLHIDEQKKKPPYIVLRAQREDYKPILKLMWKSYYDDEPTLVALGIRPNECMDQSILKTLEEGISVVSKCRYTGNIIGACVNESTNPWEPDFSDKLACSMACPKMRALYHFYAHLQRLPSLWECYHVPKIFEMSHIAVRKSDRNKGIATEMVRASRDIAADCGYKVARIDCTNFYTSLIAKKLKMRLVAEIPYCSYIGENLDPIFKTPPPHTKVEVYVDDALHEKR